MKTFKTFKTLKEGKMFIEKHNESIDKNLEFNTKTAQYNWNKKLKRLGYGEWSINEYSLNKKAPYYFYHKYNDITILSRYTYHLGGGEWIGKEIERTHTANKG